MVADTAVPQSFLFSLYFVCFIARQMAGFHKCLVTFPFSFCSVSNHTLQIETFLFPLWCRSIQPGENGGTEVWVAELRLKSYHKTLYKLLPSLALRFLDVKQSIHWSLLLFYIYWLLDCFNQKFGEKLHSTEVQILETRYLQWI